MQNASHHTRLILSVIIVAVLIGGIFYFAKQNTRPTTKASHAVLDGEAAMSPEASPRAAAELQNSDANINSKAFARIYTAFLPYEMSGSLEDAKKGIQTLKDIYHSTDPEMWFYTRASALGKLARWPGLVGNEELMSEVFSGDLAKLRVEGDDEASIEALLQQSYILKPTPQVTMDLAALHARKASMPPADNDETLRAGHIAIAERYLIEARGLEQEVDMRDGQMVYVRFLYNEAYTTGVLARLKGAPYTEQYRGKFDALLNMLRTEGTMPQKRWTAFVEWRYGVLLDTVNNDEAAAKSHLAEAARLALSSSEPTKDILYRFVQTVRGRSDSPESIEYLPLSLSMNLSPELKAFVDSVK